MNSYPKFGTCLNLMLSVLHIKSSSLARFLNVDASLVSRWIHGKRVPSYRSNYIDLISRYISNNILNSFHQKQLEDILQSICGNIPDGPDMYQKIKKALLEAQGNSIEMEKPFKEGKYLNPLPFKALHRNSANNFYAEEEAADCEYVHGMRYKSAKSKERDCIIPLCPDDRIITGINEILRTYMELLHAASHSVDISNKHVIYICLNNDINLFSRNQDLQRKWVYALYEVLKNGWSIVLLLGLSSNFEMLAGLMKLFPPLFVTGRFNIYYFKRYESVLEGREIITVPKAGSLSCYFTKMGMSLASYAFYFKTPKPQEILTSYINSIIASSCKPLINYFPSNKLPHIYRNLGRAEKFHGNRYTYSDGLSVLTLPFKIYQKHFQGSGIPPHILNSILKHHKEQLNDFRANIACCRQKDIYTIESINSLIDSALRHDKHHFDEAFLYKTRKDIIQHMSSIIEILRSCENYEIALINRSNAWNRLRVLCTVNESHSVHMEIMDSEDRQYWRNISLNEPMTVKACEVYFKKLWESIAPINRDKRQIIRWFEERIRMLSHIGRF